MKQRTTSCFLKNARSCKDLVPDPANPFAVARFCLLVGGLWWLCNERNIFDSEQSVIWSCVRVLSRRMVQRWCHLERRTLRPPDERVAHGGVHEQATLRSRRQRPGWSAVRRGRPWRLFLLEQCREVSVRFLFTQIICNQHVLGKGVVKLEQSCWYLSSAQHWKGKTYITWSHDGIFFFLKIK